MGEEGFVHVSKYPVTMMPISMVSLSALLCDETGLALIQKHVANTGQLSKRLYHMLISFVRD